MRTNFLCSANLKLDTQEQHVICGQSSLNLTLGSLGRTLESNDAKYR